MSVYNFFKKSPRCDYIVLDFETSGLNVHNCEVLEVGALKVFDNQIVDTFSTLVHPQFEVSPLALEVNGLQMKELITAPSAYQVFKKFFDFISDNKLVGYNISTFDLPILKRYAAPFNIVLSNEVDDVLQLAKRKLSDLPNYKLTTVASYFQLNTSNAHRALVDCRITNACYSSLLQLHPYLCAKTRTRLRFPKPCLYIFY